MAHTVFGLKLRAIVQLMWQFGAVWGSWEKLAVINHQTAAKQQQPLYVL